MAASMVVMMVVLTVFVLAYLWVDWKDMRTVDESDVSTVWKSVVLTVASAAAWTVASSVAKSVFVLVG